MADFITLTHHDGRKVRINTAQTTRYDADAKGRTRIFNTEPFNAGADEAAFFYVTETPEQIDAMLGVTDNWRTMGSAPKDGTEVLLWLGEPWSRVEKARWYEPWANWQCGTIPADPVREEMHGMGSAVPTRWMPVPAGPGAGA